MPNSASSLSSFPTRPPVYPDESRLSLADRRQLMTRLECDAWKEEYTRRVVAYARTCATLEDFRSGWPDLIDSMMDYTPAVEVSL
jgi:hypothetical protein